MNRRTSPFDMGWMPEEVVRLNGWDVALTYRGESRRSRLFVVDLSHVPKWAFHQKDMAPPESAGPLMPQKPGEVGMDGDRLMVRLTPTECLILVLRGEAPVPEEVACTDITDGYAALALVGPQCFEVLRKLSPVDMEAPGQEVPCAAQAPVHDLRCLLVRQEGKEAIPGLIILGDRGYGRFLLDLFLDAGKEFGISPAGWRRFESWLKE